MKYILLPVITVFFVLVFLDIAVIRVINQSAEYIYSSIKIEDKVYKFELDRGETYTKFYIGSLKENEKLTIDMNYTLSDGRKLVYNSIGYVVPMTFFMGGINDFCIDQNGKLVLDCK